jgi:hypothetical protein
MPQLKPNTKNVARIERRGALDTGRVGAAGAMRSAFMEESYCGAIHSDNHPTG